MDNEEPEFCWAKTVRGRPHSRQPNTRNFQTINQLQGYKHTLLTHLVSERV